MARKISLSIIRSYCKSLNSSAYKHALKPQQNTQQGARNQGHAQSTQDGGARERKVSEKGGSEVTKGGLK